MPNLIESPSETSTKPPRWPRRRCRVHAPTHKMDGTLITEWGKRTMLLLGLSSSLIGWEGRGKRADLDDERRSSTGLGWPEDAFLGLTRQTLKCGSFLALYGS